MWTNLDGKNTVNCSGKYFPDDTFRIGPQNNVSNDQLKDLSYQMVKHFNMEGIKKLGGFPS